MQAVILAGERGAPLYPLTARQPRAMLPLAGTPLVQYQLELLKRHGITEALLCLQVMPEAFEERFGDGRDLGMTLRYHRESAPLGTAGAVRSVADRLIGDSVLVLNGHVLTDADLSGLIAFHEDKQAAATMLLARVSDDPSRFGVVTCDADGRVTSFAEKPAAGEAAADTVNAGVYVLSRSLLRRMPPDTEYSFERQLFPLLLSEGAPVYGVVNEGRYWLPVSGLPDYQRGISDILEQRVDVEIKGGPLREGVWVGEGSSVHPTADLRGRVFVNHHTEIGREARVRGVCSIGSRCRIGEGALVEDSVIWRGTVVEPGAVVRGSILGENCVVRAGAVVQPGTVVGADGIIASVVAKLPTRGDIRRASIKFGADGWRGVLADDLTVDNVRLVAQAICDRLRAGPAPGEGIVVGYDGRAQSDEFAAAVAAVAAANGLPVRLSDKPVPAPALSFACRYFAAAGGVMVTGSDHEARYSGIKMKTHQGGPAPAAEVARIEEQLHQNLRSGDAARTGGVSPAPADIMAPYIAHCARLVDVRRIREAGLSIVVDAMHGSGAGVVPAILGGAPAAVTELRSERNPAFGGVTPEATAPNLSPLFEAVRHSRADVGLALDGDADGFGACDGAGNYVDSHGLFAVLLRHLVEGRGWKGEVVRTVTRTRMVDKLCAHYGLPLVETATGFRHAAERMLDGDVLLGGSESGSFGFKNHLPDRDGVAASLLLLEAMASAGKPLDALVADVYAMVGPHHDARADLRVPQEQARRVAARLQSFKDGAFADAAVAGVVRKDGTRIDLADGTWLLVRASGAEPVVRLYAEATTAERARQLVEAGSALVNNA